MENIQKVIDQLRGKLARQLAAVEDTRQHVNALQLLKKDDINQLDALEPKKK